MCRNWSLASLLCCIANCYNSSTDMILVVRSTKHLVVSLSRYLLYRTRLPGIQEKITVSNETESDSPVLISIKFRG